jgi:hypothetical protein
VVRRFVFSGCVAMGTPGSCPQIAASVHCVHVLSRVRSAVCSCYYVAADERIVRCRWTTAQPADELFRECLRAGLLMLPTAWWQCVLGAACAVGWSATLEAGSSAHCR